MREKSGTIGREEGKEAGDDAVKVMPQPSRHTRKQATMSDSPSAATRPHEVGSLSF